MYTLKTEHSFDAAHFLYGYEGKCSNIHGHRWRVVAEVSSDELETTGHFQTPVNAFTGQQQHATQQDKGLRTFSWR